jgi:HEAT repeat protein
MANPAAEKWLGQLQGALAERMDRWAAAINVIAGPGLERGSVARTEAEQVSAAFERFLAGGIQSDELIENVAGARPDAFWAAVEAFSDGASAEEWRRLASPLLAVPEVVGESRRLRHLSRWRRALAARRVGLLEAPELSEPLRKALARGPELVTQQAALALSRLGDLPGLAWLLQHPDATARRTRRQLVTLLERFGPGVAGELRAAIAGAQATAPVLVAAVEVLGLHRDAASAGALENVLRQGALEARVAAARALGRIGAAESGPALIAALDDEAWQVRAQAARALGAVRAPANVGPLAGRTGDVAWWVRRHAAYALGRHGPAGRRTLAEIAEGGQDLFAAAIAREVLQQIEWEAEIPGGFASVA